MIKKIFLGLAFVLLSLNFVVAQERTLTVKTDDNATFQANTAQLSNVITRNNGKLEDQFQLSFQVPNVLRTVLPKTGIVLTAFNKDGSIFGQQTWCSASKGMTNEFSANELQIVLNANPKLEGANSYSLSFREELGATLEQCVAAAKNACPGGIASVNSGADGSCSFTCQ